MLKLFEVTGFKNFEKTLKLDFSDIRDYKFNNACVENNMLSKIIIYGKNAAGKSNFGLAMFDIVSHLSGKNVTPGLYDYYLNVNNKLGYAEFHYIFSFGIDEVDYKYRKDANQTLIYETITINSKLLFNYDYKDNSGNLDGLKELAPTLNWVFKDNDSFLKYVINNTDLPDEHSLRKTMKFVNNMLWFRNFESKYIGYNSISNNNNDFSFNNKTLKEFESLLHKSGIDENLIEKKDIDGIHRLYFDTKTPLPFFKVASSGTKALYTFFCWFKTASNASLVFIDEFDAYYHYELSESIVEILEKMQNLQVILTSHNTNLLSNRIMRPDCYFILTKDKLTSFANATDRELREGHNLEKLYMSGEFNE